MLIRYNTKTFRRIFFTSYLTGNALLGALGLCGLFTGTGVLTTLSGTSYLTIVSILSRNRRFRGSSLAVLLCFFSLLYLNIPTGYILFKGSDYTFGEGLVSIPFPQAEYHECLPKFFLYLTLLWSAVWLGIISAGRRGHHFRGNAGRRVTLETLLLLGAVTIVVQLLDYRAFANVRLIEAIKTNTLVTFIFFDHAYMLMAGFLIAVKLNASAVDSKPRKLRLLLGTLFVCFALADFVIGSKAALLTVFCLLLLYPALLCGEYGFKQTILPSPRLVGVLLMLAPFLFYLADAQRVTLGSGKMPSVGSLLASVRTVRPDLMGDVSEGIFRRFSQGGLDRLILVYQSFVVHGYDGTMAGNYGAYLSKNALNLLLPGTPYLEAYAPSSQLFGAVLEKGVMNGNMSATELILSLNTQPYTIFGVFWILFGMAAPACLYLYASGFRYVYDRVGNWMVKLSMLYFFVAALSSYGFEVVIGNSAHLLVSMWVIYQLMVGYSWFRAGFAMRPRVVARREAG